jgi:NAD(P)-dependent dehydrogenase (short-subunit alcohol dehydrogenase family)
MQAAQNRPTSNGHAADWSMKGKTVLFTGASRGMGRYAAMELGRRGAKILVFGHSEARGVAAVKAIRGNGGSAEFLRADMGNADEVTALAGAVQTQAGSVDVLIHSAGGLQPSAARIVKGQFGAELESPIRLFFRVASLFADPMARASEQYVRLAADPTLANVSGMYFVSGREKPQGSSPLALDPDVQRHINDAAEAWAAPFLHDRQLFPAEAN